MKTWNHLRLLGLVMALSLVLAACGGGGEDEAADPGAADGTEAAPEDMATDDTATEDMAGESTEEGGTEPAGAAGNPLVGTVDYEAVELDSEWFDKEEFLLQMEQRAAQPEGPEGEPWLQYIDAEMTDTSEYATEGPWNICFSNAAVNNPWRQVGFTTMQQQVEMLGDEIANFNVVDAGGNDAQQISDIEALVAGGDCDLLIVSPNTTASLTPAVEAACQELPVVVFDRGVNTDCPVSFIHPIGGYAFGAAAAEFLVQEVPEGGNILALRILPGVDVLETRWAAGQAIMEQAGLNIVGSEFTEGDAAAVVSIVSDYLLRGEVDGVWMDAGATSVAAAEAFENQGMDVPPITGEDQMDFLVKWQQDGLNAVAPTYPTYQWRTPILAAQMILSGEEVPSEWVLPQPTIVQDTLEQYVNPEMPPLHYALCGCETMPGYPEVWQ